MVLNAAGVPPPPLDFPPLYLQKFHGWELATLGLLA